MASAFSTASPIATDVGVARTQLVVDADAATLAELEAGGLREARVGPHADRGEHELGGTVDPSLRVAVSRAELGDLRAEAMSTPAVAEAVGDRTGHLRVERRQHLLPSSTSVTSRPRCTRFSTISRPMNPAPMTSALFGATVERGHRGVDVVDVAERQHALAARDGRAHRRGPGESTSAS